MIWEKIERLLIHELAIDLGSTNTLIYSRNQGIVLAEPTAIATDKATGDVVAVGREAQEMLGREPRDITVHRPVRSGVVADYELTEKMLKHFIQQALRRKPRSWTFLQLVIGTPSASNYIERRALADAARRVNGFQVSLVEEGVAAAIGSGTLFQDSQACLVVDIGIAMDQAISDYIRHEHHVVVGEQAAEMIKITLGAALPMSHNRSMTVAGKSLNSGSPQEVTITSDEVFHVLDGIVRMITEGVHRVLEQASPETAADLCKTGLTLTGGGSLLRDLDVRFRNEVELPVYRADNPLESVALGLGYLLEDERALNQFKIDENAAEWTSDAEMIYSAAR
jgi:rod shape-determining protein MreB